MCDKLFSDYMVTLKTISKIPRNGQLDTKQSILDIYTGGPVAWIYRKWNGDGKEETTKYLDKFYTDLSAFIREQIKTYESDQKNKDNLILITNQIWQSRKGVDQLIQTYKKYVSICSSLEHLNEKLLNLLFDILKILPHESIDPDLVKIHTEKSK